LQRTVHAVTAAGWVGTTVVGWVVDAVVSAGALIVGVAADGATNSVDGFCA